MNDYSLHSEQTNAQPVFMNVPKVLVRAGDGAQINGYRTRVDGAANDNLWFGWFSHWGKDWLPIFFCRDDSDTPHPVMLCKVRGEGLVIATTLWLSNSNPELAAKLVEVASVPSRRAQVLACQKRAIARRKAVDTALFATLLAIVLVAFFGIVHIAQDQDRNWILAIFGVGLIVIVQSAWQLFRWRFFVRPLGTSWLYALIPYKRLRYSRKP